MRLFIKTLVIGLLMAGFHAPLSWGQAQSKPKESAESLKTERFDVPAGFFIPVKKGETPPPVLEQLKIKGVDFQVEGSRAELDLEGKLVVVHTVDKLKMIRELLDRERQWQIVGRLDYVQMDKKEAEGLFKKDVKGTAPQKLTPELQTALSKLIKAKKSTVLETLSAKTLPGTSVEVKSVREMVYPTEFERHENVTVPGSFQTRELGPILAFTPKMESESKVVKMEVEARWDGSPDQNKIPEKTAVFFENAVKTSVDVESGQMVLLGAFDGYRGGKDSEVDRDSVLLFILKTEVVP